MSSVWLGLDLGTQSVRALAVTDAGVRLAAAARPLRGHRDGRRHEQDPHDWWRACAGALREVTAAIGDRPVAGVAACSTSGTVLLTGPDGEPLTPGLMYDDARAAGVPGLVDAVRAEGDDLWQRLGHRPQASWALPKLVCLRASGDWPAGARVAHQGDYIMRRMAGHEVATDSGQALKTGLDLTDLSWPYAYFDRLGLDPLAFPDAVLPGTFIGTVSPAAAAETGVPAGTALIAGTTDGCAAQLAAGAVRPGDWNSVLGTTLVVKGVSAEPVREPTGAVYNHRAPQGRGWLPGGASSTGAGTIAELFGSPDADLPPWAAVPAAYPLLGTGERFPFLAPDATGVVAAGAIGAVGTGGTGVAGTGGTGVAGMLPLRDAIGTFGRGPALAAVMLGVACLERLCYDLLGQAGAPPLTALTVTGGGSRNAAWNQLRCDMLGVPVRVPEYPEPALGAAMLAASSAGDLVELAGRLVAVREELEPGAGQPAAYHRFLDLLEGHGWIGEPLAGYARNRSAA